MSQPQQPDPLSGPEDAACEAKLLEKGPSDGAATIRIVDQSALIHIASQGQPHVTIGFDGGVTFHDGADVDEAARIFWRAVADKGNIRAALEDYVDA